ncbi:archaeal proteasome endopeptidase complex subunit alpha [Halorubellus litoreus]|uniref:Proteasome subunit alpha n=1 Tax=Halorubellus litoreus TaxID=755308 RepID=A0ABD5V8H5_9EURY
MEDNRHQAYDRGSTIFSPDGRLYQVEYARQAVKRGTTSVGLRTESGIVLAASRRVRSPLVVLESIEKTHYVDDHIAVASAGHVADGRHLIDVCRRDAQENRFEFDRPISVAELTDLLSEYIQERTQTGGYRPFGAALLVGGVRDGESRLFSIDPSGTTYEWTATGIGNGAEAARESLAQRHEESMSLDEGVDLALETLAPLTETVRPGVFDVSVVDASTASVELLSTETVDAHLSELDVSVDDE